MGEQQRTATSLKGLHDPGNRPRKMHRHQKPTSGEALLAQRSSFAVRKFCFKCSSIKSTNRFCNDAIMGENSIAKPKITKLQQKNYFSMRYMRTPHIAFFFREHNNKHGLTDKQTVARPADHTSSAQRQK